MQLHLFHHVGQTHLLQSIALTGLGTMPHLDFLVLTEMPLPPETPHFVAWRIRMLRIIVLRQSIQLPDALIEAQRLMTESTEIPLDDIFMLHCETARIALVLGQEERAIRHLSEAEAISTQVQPELRGYWHIAMAFVYGYLCDDQRQHASLRQAKHWPPADHFYAIAWNAVVYKANLAWALELSGNYSEALDFTVKALSESKKAKLSIATTRHLSVVVLYLRAQVGKYPRLQEFSQLRAVWGLCEASNSALEIPLSLGEALTAIHVQDDEAAHRAFARAIRAIEFHNDYGRYALHLYHHALGFYRERHKLDELVSVLEGRMTVLEQLRRRASHLFHQLNVPTSHLMRLRKELLSSRAELLDCLSAIGEKRDDATGLHARRVERLTFQLAEAMHLPNAHEIAEATRLHDLGKVSLPDSVLLKPGPLSPEEWEAMKLHTTTGAQMLSLGKSSILQLAQIIARSHHERWDGTGYPDGLAGEEIPLPARIAAVADVFDALTSERPYKAAWSTEEARKEIRAKSGRHFDPKVVKALEQVLDRQIPLEYPESLI